MLEGFALIFGLCGLGIDKIKKKIAKAHYEDSTRSDFFLERKIRKKWINIINDKLKGIDLNEEEQERYGCKYGCPGATFLIHLYEEYDIPFTTNINRSESIIMREFIDASWLESKEIARAYLEALQRYYKRASMISSCILEIDAVRLAREQGMSEEEIEYEIPLYMS